MSYNNSNMNIRFLISTLGIIIITVFATLQLYKVYNSYSEVEKTDVVAHTSKGVDGLFSLTDAEKKQLMDAAEEEDVQYLQDHQDNVISNGVDHDGNYSLIRKISTGVIVIVIILIIALMISELYSNYPRKKKNKIIKRKHDRKVSSSSKNNSQKKINLLNDQKEELDSELSKKTVELNASQNELKKLTKKYNNIYSSYIEQIQESLNFFINHKKKIDEILKKDEKGAALYASLVSFGSLYKYFNDHAGKERFYKGDESSIAYQIGKNVYEIIHHLELNEEESRQCISGIKDKIEQKLEYVKVEQFSNSIRFNGDMHERLPGSKHDQNTVSPFGWAIKLKEDSATNSYLKKAPVR